MKKKFSIYLIVLFSLFMNTISYSLSSNSNKTTDLSDNYQNLSETIHALDITRKKYLIDLPRQSKSLKKEYSIFIDYLSFQINYYCTKVSKNYGDEFIRDLPCSLNNIQELNKDNYQTSEEKIESLDNDFMAALGEFDEMLLIEDEKIAQISKMLENEGTYNNSQSGSSNRSSTNDTNDDSKHDKEENKKGNKANKNNSKMNSSSKGRHKQSGNKEYQRKKLDEIDDDIVARQLKEAAEKETNADLKEKLWDEYYRYKKTIADKK